MSNPSSADSEVVWEGKPWVLPGTVEVTIEVVTLAIALTWVELTVFKLSFSPIVAATYALVALLWVAGATRLALVAASNHYTLRGSSLEIRRGILGRKIFTVSAAGFSDLEVTKSLTGRMLNIGSIVIETNSERDLRLVRIRDPIKVSAMIRQVMTVPMVRVAGGGQLSAGNPAGQV